MSTAFHEIYKRAVQLSHLYGKGELDLDSFSYKTEDLVIEITQYLDEEIGDSLRGRWAEIEIINALDLLDRENGGNGIDSVESELPDVISDFLAALRDVALGR